MPDKKAVDNRKTKLLSVVLPFRFFS